MMTMTNKDFKKYLKKIPFDPGFEKLLAYPVYSKQKQNKSKIKKFIYEVKEF